MIIKEIDEKPIWDEFVIQNNNTFLHSWEWGEFNRELGYGVGRIGIYDEKNLCSVFLLLTIKAKRGLFLFIPHGPVVKRDVSLSAILNTLVPYLKKRAYENNCSFIRISPLFENTVEYKGLFKKFGFIDAPTHMHSELCWVLDLKPTEDELLMSMRKTTRYLVKQHQKHNIVVTKSTSMADFDSFYTIYRETEKRQNFRPFYGLHNNHQ